MPTCIVLCCCKMSSLIELINRHVDLNKTPSLTSQVNQSYGRHSTLSFNMAKFKNLYCNMNLVYDQKVLFFVPSIRYLEVTYCLMCEYIEVTEIWPFILDCGMFSQSASWSSTPTPWYCFKLRVCENRSIGFTSNDVDAQAS